MFVDPFAGQHTGPPATTPGEPSAWLLAQIAPMLGKALPGAAFFQPERPELCCQPVQGLRAHVLCPCARCGAAAPDLPEPVWTAHYKLGPFAGFHIDLCASCAAVEWPEGQVVA